MTTDIITPATPMQSMRRLIASGVAAVGIFVIAGGIWSVFAPLESAAVGPGQVEAESFRKRIEHLEGGIIGHILVHDGDVVQPGQVLIRLDDTKARTTLLGLHGQYWDALAAEARLVAERDGAEATSSRRRCSNRRTPLRRVSPPHSKDLCDPALIVADQNRPLSAAHRRGQRGDRRLRRPGGGRQSARCSDRRGGRRSEEARRQGLEQAGAARVAARSGRHRRQARRSTAQIAKAKQTIAENEVNILNLENDSQKEVASDLQDTQKKIHQLAEQIEAAEYVLTRIEVSRWKRGRPTSNFTPPAGSCSRATG
jgi:HlyD family secretion protein